MLFEYWESVTSKNEVLSSGIQSMKNSSEDIFLQFLLDCSAIEEIREIAELFGADVYDTLFKLFVTAYTGRG